MTLDGWEARKRKGWPNLEDIGAGRCLGLEDLAGLPDGVRVVIVWGGGNGPHHYIVKWFGEAAWAVTERDPDWLVSMIYAPREGDILPGVWVEHDLSTFDIRSGTGGE